MNNIIKQRCYRISQSKLKYLIYQLQNQLFINTILFNKSYNFIDRFFIWIRSSTIARVINIYLFIRSTTFSTIARIFYSLQFEKNSEIHAFASQIDVFFSISFETVFRFVRQHFIYFICSTIFFRIFTNIFITIRNIWRKYTRLHFKSTRFFFFIQKIFQIFRSRSRSFVMNFSTKFSSKTIQISWKSRKSRTYEKRLTNLKNSHWFSRYHSKEMMIVVEFDIIDFSNFAKCICCWYWFMQNDCEKSLTKHSFYCSFFKQFHEETAKRIELKTLKIVKQVELKKIEKLKISKFISVVVDIEYFDSTLLCDIQKFDLYYESTSFCQHLQNIHINYREKKLFSLLFECFRDFALIWYRQQNELEIEIVKKNLNEWLKTLIIAFFTKSFAKSNFFFRNSRFFLLFRLFFFRFNIIRVWIVSRSSRHWFDYCNIFKKSFAKKSFANIAKRFLIRKINFTSTFVNITRMK